MSKSLYRMRVLAGSVPDSDLVNNLYENYFVDADEVEMNVIREAEGPFEMPNGRTVFYSLHVKEYYDAHTGIKLEADEIPALLSEEEYDPGVVLTAVSASEPKYNRNMKLETIEQIKPMALGLLNNGYDKFEIHVGDMHRIAFDPEAETVEEACWKGYKKQGMKKKKGKMVPNCVKEDDVSEDEVLEERSLTAAEKEKLDRLKKEYEGGSMYQSMMDEYGEEAGKQVFYGKLTNMAKEAVEDSSILEGHSDGDMAVKQVKTMQANVKRLMSMLSPDADYPAWWQSKLTKAEDYLDVVTDYLAASDAVTEGVDSAKLKGVDLTKLNAAEIQELYADLKDNPDKYKGPEDVQKIADKMGANQAVTSVPAVPSLDEAAKYIKKGSKSGDSVGFNKEDTKRSTKKAEKDKEDKKFSNDSPFAKGDPVMHGSKKMYVTVPNGPANLVGVADSMKGKTKMVKVGALKAVNENAVDATVFGGNPPYDAVDDMEQKGERTGKDYLSAEVKVPREVIQAIDKRIAEVQESIDRYDRKGYNEKSIKVNVIEALEQIKKNLERGDLEGLQEAQIYFGTLMSPIWDFFPAQLVKHLAKGPMSD